MENLGIDSKLLIAQLINFGLFFFIFKKYLAKPFIKFINQEKENIEEKDKLLQKAKVMEEKLVEKEKAIRDAAKKEADKYIQEAVQSAQKIKEAMLDEARQEVEALKKKSQKQLAQEQADLLKQTKQKINEMSFLIVNSALKDVLTTEMRKKISDSMVKNSAKDIHLNEN